MKNLTCAVAVSLAILAASSAQAGQVWKVAEGANGNLKGSWTITATGGQIQGSATMSNGGQSVTYFVAGALANGVYTLQRVSPSDNTNCTYRGQPNPDGSIAGMANCNGQSNPWIVTISQQ
ncbi:MAG: hypothetical protein WB816_02335 [Methylocystis sp.]